MIFGDEEATAVGVVAVHTFGNKRIILLRIISSGKLLNRNPTHVILCIIVVIPYYLLYVTPGHETRGMCSDNELYTPALKIPYV